MAVGPEGAARLAAVELVASVGTERWATACKSVTELLAGDEDRLVRSVTRRLDATAEALLRAESRGARRAREEIAWETRFLDALDCVGPGTRAVLTEALVAFSTSRPSGSMPSSEVLGSSFNGTTAVQAGSWNLMNNYFTREPWWKHLRRPSFAFLRTTRNRATAVILLVMAGAGTVGLLIATSGDQTPHHQDLLVVSGQRPVVTTAKGQVTWTWSFNDHVASTTNDVAMSPGGGRKNDGLKSIQGALVRSKCNDRSSNLGWYLRADNKMVASGSLTAKEPRASLDAFPLPAHVDYLVLGGYPGTSSCTLRWENPGLVSAGG
ncbi:hypothetical protein OV320_0735 [Actinobacteria bacterium OV320]|nr:hypothetical protein OV320_0735 [Actinobacteria bacterium OV320]